ncbi:hypothetical protein [Leifsonia shinshuensis]|uniref:hypothetical protein n=1 Tax=Leifsonia shinshuensis TaxID=150026 RepID=UPI0028632BE4|nr:hypothetical protein [Leifsonia shinshuensis]MDR6972532.1 hypothetical protein [Leifsonia shinshuensis]
MSVDDGDDIPARRLGAWRRAFDDPEVERVVIVGQTVRVCLRSGVELEWCLDEPETL